MVNINVSLAVATDSRESVRQRYDCRSLQVPRRFTVIPEVWSLAIPSQKPIQLILARQLASSLAMPIMIVDCAGALIYWNEPAEVLLAIRFEEAGEIPASQWGSQFTVTDEERNPLPREQWPLVIALTQQTPVSRIIWVQSHESAWRHVSWTSVPFIAQGGEFLGVQSVFWEI